MIAKLRTMLIAGRGIKHLTNLFSAFLFIAACHPALAQDCTKLSNAVDKLLCGDADFRRADHDMADAYFQLLRSTSDHDMREGIIASQRRWIKARMSEVLSLDDPSDSQIDKHRADRQAIIDMTANRKFDLSRRTKDSHKYVMVAEMDRQRNQLSAYSGGPYQGFTTDCSFMRPPFGDGYFCTSTIMVQEGKHICMRSLEWASGHQSMISIVAAVKSEHIEQEAICKEGYTSKYPSCPDPDAAWVWPQPKRPIADDFSSRPVGWKRSPTGSSHFLRDPILRLDPEATFDGSDEYENSRFLKRCAKNASFPPKSIRKTLASPHAD